MNFKCWEIDLYMKEKIMLVDGNSIINRAFYAMPLLTNKSGIFTNGIFGFLNILFRFLDEEQPDYLGVSFDLPAPTFRHEKFSDYKGTRKGMPDELAAQMPILKDLLIKMGIRIFEVEGFEADDVLGTLAKESEKDGLKVTVLSGDKDLLQLATQNIKIKIPKTSKGQTTVENYFGKDVLEKIGVTPEEFIEMKGLMGDTSDNIPGVPGIGAKTALKIIQEYKSVEKAIENAQNVTPKRASENLVTYKEQAILSRDLARIITNVPLEFSYSDVKLKNIYTKEALDTLISLDIKAFNKKFSETVDTQNAKKKCNYIMLENHSEIADLEKVLLTEKLVSFSIVNLEGKVIGLSFCVKDLEAYFIPFNEITEIMFIDGFKNFFESDVPKITMDSKFDKLYLEKRNIFAKNIIFDGALGGYILDSSKTTYLYHDLAQDYLDETYKTWEDIFGKGKSRKHHLEIEEKELLAFGAAQSEILFRCYPIMMKNIKAEDLYELYYDIELPLIDVLKDMEVFGIKVDKEELLKYQAMMEEKTDKLTKRIYELAGEEFNINSPKQLGVVLFENMKLTGAKKTKSGYSTNVDVLTKMIDSHEIIAEILEYRTISKLKSTYADGLLKVLDKKTNKIHSTFNQFITTTGRISSTEPNLQNIPIKMEIGRILRKVFIPDTDYIFVDADYSQIELRVLAHLSGDETLINAFKNEDDIHRLTASQVFNVPYDDVSDFQRSSAKAVNFGIIYGMGSYSLGQDLKISKKEADSYIQGYFAKYPKIKGYLDGLISDAKEKGYATTIFNRRRNIPEINSKNFNMRGFGERVAMNMPIQGTAADIIKIAMIKVSNKIKEEKLDAKLILQVHDELLLEVNKNIVDEVAKMLQDEMENAVQLLVPLSVETDTGENWYETM